MINLALILFALAAVVGLAVFLRVIKGEPTSRPAVLAHGGIAAAALVLLIVYYLSNPAGLTISLVLFIVAALGGFVMFGRDVSGKSIPKPLAFIHAGAAVLAFVLLLMAVL